MKKAGTTIFLAITFALYASLVRRHTDASIVAVSQAVATPFATIQPTAAPTPEPTKSPDFASTPGITPTPLPTASPAPTPAGRYKDGSYVGSTEDVYYGNVQVQATVSGGKLTAVAFLSYPSDRNTSVRINQQAMPYLQQEAIAAQSASVDVVSGATLTSEGFQRSLAAALAKAN